MSTTITAFDAKNRLGNLLDRVQAGEELVITRHGEPVARLIPIGDQRRAGLASALDAFRQVRSSLKSSGKSFSTGEVQAMKRVGRR
jgi:prevent-host-death family protein